jgi:pentatricopeptide repeat protein
MADSLTFRSDKELIYKTLNEAEKFIKIVVFQLTSKSIVDLLIKKSDERLDIEVITLPEDSYAKVEDRDKIRMLYDSMISKGIELNLCDWEVGDPSLTDTSLSGEMAEGGGSKWYSLHGKFIITDKCSLISSSNLSDDLVGSLFIS